MLLLLSLLMSLLLLFFTLNVQYKLLSKRQLQGLIKQRLLASTSLQHVLIYQEDHARIYIELYM